MAYNIKNSKINYKITYIRYKNKYSISNSEDLNDSFISDFMIAFKINYKSSRNEENYK
jgi:hypothetical protein